MLKVVSVLCLFAFVSCQYEDDVVLPTRRGAVKEDVWLAYNTTWFSCTNGKCGALKNCIIKIDGDNLVYITANQLSELVQKPDGHFYQYREGSPEEMCTNLRQVDDYYTKISDELEADDLAETRLSELQTHIGTKKIFSSKKKLWAVYSSVAERFINKKCITQEATDSSPPKCVHYNEVGKIIQNIGIEDANICETFSKLTGSNKADRLRNAQYNCFNE